MEGDLHRSPTHDPPLWLKQMTAPISSTGDQLEAVRYWRQRSGPWAVVRALVPVLLTLARHLAASVLLLFGTALRPATSLVPIGQAGKGGAAPASGPKELSLRPHALATNSIVAPGSPEGSEALLAAPHSCKAAAFAYATLLTR